MKGLPQDVTEDDVKSTFSDALDVRLPRRTDGAIKGFAYVDFATEQEVKDLVEGSDVFEVSGTPVALDYVGAKSKRDSQGGGDSNRGEENTMFVKNLAWAVNEDSLREVFENATAVRIPLNENQQSRGYVSLKLYVFYVTSRITFNSNFPCLDLPSSSSTQLKT